MFDVIVEYKHEFRFAFSCTQLSLEYKKKNFLSFSLFHFPHATRRKWMNKKTINWVRYQARVYRWMRCLLHISTVHLGNPDLWFHTCNSLWLWNLLWWKKKIYNIFIETNCVINITMELIFFWNLFWFSHCFPTWNQYYYYSIHMRNLFWNYVNISVGNIMRFNWIWVTQFCVRFLLQLFTLLMLQYSIHNG